MMFTVMLGTITETLTQYPEWVSQFGFAIGTAIFLILLFGGLLIWNQRYILNTLTKQMELQSKTLRELETKDDEHKNILIEINTQIKTALNIILKNKVNGNDEQH